DSASEMSTLGFVIGVILRVSRVSSRPKRTWREEPGSILRDGGYGPGSRFAWPGRQMQGNYAAFGSCALVSAKAQSIHWVNSATSLVSIVAPHQMRKPAGASRWPAKSKPAPSFSTRPTIFLIKSICASEASEAIAGSVTFMHTDVLDRISGVLARKSIHGVLACQSASTL